MNYSENLKSEKIYSASATEIGGINVNGRKGPGNPADLLNFTDKHFPSACVRPRRAVIRDLISADCIFGDDTLAWVDSGRLYYGGNEVTGLYLTSGRKKILGVGKMLVIFPDLVYYDTASGEYGNMSVTHSAESAYVCCTDSELNEITGYTVSSKEPENAAVGDYCALTEGENVTMKRFDGNMWRQCRTFVKISAAGIGAGINAGDTVECSGLERVFGNAFTVDVSTPSALYAEGCVANPFYTADISVRRIVPVFDHVCVSQGRLWGVRRGADNNGNYICAVYASAPGSPMNFSVSGGGLYLEINISGSFTGLTDYLGTAVAFTESEIIELTVKNNDISALTIRTFGLSEGCSESVVCDSGVLYYKSTVGVCRYDGSYPECISAQIGAVTEKSASGSPAVCAGGIYYIVLADKCGNSYIYSYNSLRESWQKHDDPGIIAFAKRKENIYAITSSDQILLLDYDSAGDDEKTYCCSAGYPSVESEIGWSFESSEIGSSEFFSKIPQKAVIRADFSGTDELTLSIRTDGVISVGPVSLPVPEGKVITVPLKCGKCDTFSLILGGKGDFRLEGFSVIYRSGGENSVWN